MVTCALLGLINVCLSLKTSFVIGCIAAKLDRIHFLAHANVNRKLYLTPSFSSVFFVWHPFPLSSLIIRCFITKFRKRSVCLAFVHINKYLDLTPCSHHPLYHSCHLLPWISHLLCTNGWIINKFGIYVCDISLNVYKDFPSLWQYPFNFHFNYRSYQTQACKSVGLKQV